MAELGVVIGWVASPIIKAMVDTVRSYIGSRLPWRSAVEGELYRLETVLIQILAVVSTAESLPATDNESHLALLRQMKDAVYEADDLLDEFGYLLLQSEVNSGSKVSLPSAFFFSPVGKSFRNKLKKVLSKLDKVKDCAQTFLDMVGATVTTVAGSSGVASALRQHPTSSFPLENQFFGRKEERGRILQWLLESGDQSEILLSWSETEGEIHKLACNNLGNGSVNLNELQEQLKKSVETKRFLLVLDDVWNDEGIKVGE
uniref:Uncharacterized protein n=1 Tax=Ananas comosus var. bracteatus TaxID=296719 RepID=A0A6V7PKN6_ANACO|nr:unnamed protein product [Ananas comosus var. bracteatus]